ncbi:MAG: hypothetical protein ACRCXZ_01700, partial [Patescibacteria group bacterium]
IILSSIFFVFAIWNINIGLVVDSNEPHFGYIIIGYIFSLFSIIPLLFLTYKFYKDLYFYPKAKYLTITLDLKFFFLNFITTIFSSFGLFITLNFVGTLFEVNSVRDVLNSMTSLIVGLYTIINLIITFVPLFLGYRSKFKYLLLKLNYAFLTFVNGSSIYVLLYFFTSSQRSEIGIAGYLIFFLSLTSMLLTFILIKNKSVIIKLPFICFIFLITFTFSFGAIMSFRFGF